MSKKKVTKKPARKKPIKLDIGCGDKPTKGYVGIDRKLGKEAFPLDYPDGSVTEIHASHILEHYGHCKTVEVLQDWVRALKPGGLLRIAVPDFDKIVDGYRNGSDLPLEGYLMGGHVDSNDAHGAIFNRLKLGALLKAIGLVDIKPWESKHKDCAALFISLNLQGRKLTKSRAASIESSRPKKVVAVMSVPRLGFMDNFFCCYQSLLPLGIHLKKTVGAYWGQCLERGMIQSLTDGADALLAIDYDTVFTRSDVESLIDLLARYPQADAVCGMQMHRSRKFPLLTIMQNGKPVPQVDMSELDNELLKTTTAHFGLTLIRTKALQDMPHPWFKPTPDKTGNWGDGKIDDDIHFWLQWAKAGKTLHMANRVPIGHLELMVLWPGADGGEFKHIFQHPNDYFEKGKPGDIWK